MECTQRTAHRRFEKASSRPWFHFASLLVHSVIFLSLVGPTDRRQPAAASREATQQFNDMTSFITTIQATRDQLSRYPAQVAPVPLRFTVPPLPQRDIVSLQQQFLDKTKIRLQEDSAGRFNYARQIQPYLQPSPPHQLPLRIAEDVPAEKLDVTLKLVPLQFLRPPSK